MKSPENSVPEWVDPKGSTVPAYLRKKKYTDKVAERNFIVSTEKPAALSQEVKNNASSPQEKTANDDATDQDLNVEELAKLYLGKLEAIKSSVMEKSPNWEHELAVTKIEVEQEIIHWQKKYPRLTEGLLENLKKEHNVYAFSRYFPKDLSKKVASYFKNNQNVLQKIENILDPNIPDKDFKSKIWDLDRKIKNHPFWYYVDEFSILTSSDVGRKITFETWTEDSNRDYVPASFLGLYS